ncbi:DNA mismatch repair protein Msh3 [Armadillidium vulgare]|nr:DNA mismatch repair protein Msh3 [Armadillidium vulgare]
MSARGGTQLTISKFFASKNKSNGVRTDDECPPRKKSKISEVQFSPPLKRTKSGSSNESSPKRPKCNGSSDEFTPEQISPNTQRKSITNICKIFVGLPVSPKLGSSKSKLESFRFKGSSSSNQNEVIDVSPTKKSQAVGKSGRGFVIPRGAKLTPLETQVVSIKENYPDTLLFVECGYKYRFFGEDAETAAKELNIIAHLDHNFQTASIPTHRLHVHVRRLVAKVCYKVGVVKQTETAALKAIGSNKTAPFSRELTALYTKATLIGEDVNSVGTEDLGDVSEQTTSSLMVLTETKPESDKDNKIGIVLVSIQPTTGDLIYDSFDDTLARAQLWGRLEHIHPVEVIVNETVSEATRKAIRAVMTRHDDCIRIEDLPESVFDYSSCLQSLCQLYEGKEDKIRHISQLPKPVVSCLGAILQYLREFKLEKILTTASDIAKLSSAKEYMNLPGPTLRNLEVVLNSADGNEKGSLFWVLNQTNTKFGARVLRHWLLHPLLNIEKIKERQEMIGEIMHSDAPPIIVLKDLLLKLPDFEKSITTIFYKKCSPYEFWTTVSGLSRVQRQLSSVSGKNLLDLFHTPLAQLISTVIEKLSDIHQFPENIDEASAKENKKTSLLKDWSEFEDVVQRQKDINSVEAQLKEMRAQIARTLGVSSFDYTSVSGLEYLIEVKNNNLKAIPSSWTKVNSTKVCCRFRSKEVEKLFTKLQQLREQLQADCNQAWIEVLERFSEHYQDYREAIKCIGSLDALLSLAKVSRSNGYSKPEVVDSENEEVVIQIKGGKHPIVHQLRGDENFSNGERIMLVTGPNMGGKSCYMRQVALISLMAQIGSYVPAESARISVLDGIYTRMGATDEIYSGKSSLMVEIGETSDIMRVATHKSLVILDELGRGTSTHDGVALATASLDFFLNKIKCLTIFVTHYLTLCDFGDLYPDIVGNHHMSFIVNEDGDDSDVDVITFLYQLTSGDAGQSYGLNVARLANIPQAVLKKASFMLYKDVFKQIFKENDVPKREELFSILEAIKR